jgi:hypothetical protein
VTSRISRSHTAQIGCAVHHGFWKARAREGAPLNDRCGALDAGDHGERSTSMTQQGGRSGYRHDQRNGMAEQAMERTRELADEALDRADEWLKPTGRSIKEQPMTVLAMVGGLAFAAGAFSMLKNSRKQSRYEELVANLFPTCRAVSGGAKAACFPST